MALSGKDGKVYLHHECAPDLSGVDTIGEDVALPYEQVLRFEVTPSAFKSEYGHDKSYGWQDLVYGIKRLEGTIEVRIGEAGMSLAPGQIVLLVLYPFGVACGRHFVGYAGVDSWPLSVNVERGEPVSATYRFSSKGKWKGLNDAELWGGFECATCAGGSGITSSGSSMAPALLSMFHDPEEDVVYQDEPPLVAPAEAAAPQAA